MVVRISTRRTEQLRCEWTLPHFCMLQRNTHVSQSHTFPMTDYTHTHSLNTYLQLYTIIHHYLSLWLIRFVSITQLLTQYPAGIGNGATFNMKLVTQMGAAISDEARALHQQTVIGVEGKPVGLDFWAPNINIFRDPRWGRGQVLRQRHKQR